MPSLPSPSLLLLHRLGRRFRHNRMARAKYFSRLDLSKAFNQVRMAQKSQETTAVKTPFGLYESKVMLLGMKSSGPHFQSFLVGNSHQHTAGESEADCATLSRRPYHCNGRYGSSLRCAGEGPRTIHAI